MKKEPKRSHSKVSQLPPELLEAVENQFRAGITYQQITDYLNSLGHEVSRSSVNRYGQKFFAKVEQLNIFQERIKIIADQSKGNSALEMIDATNQMALQVIMEYLIELESLEGAKATEIFKALALLQRGTVQVEKMKMDIKKKADEAVKNIESKAKTSKNLDAETVAFLKEQIYGLTS